MGKWVYKTFHQAPERWPERLSATRSFYKTGELTLSDAVIEAALLPGLSETRGVNGIALFGCPGHLKLLCSPAKGEELLLGLAPHGFTWKDDEQVLRFKLICPASCEPKPPIEAWTRMLTPLVGNLAVMLMDALAHGSGLFDITRPPECPEKAVSVSHDTFAVQLSAIPEIHAFLEANPLQENFVFNLFQGVDIAALRLQKLLTFKSWSVSPQGFSLNVTFSEEFEKLKNELFDTRSGLKGLKDKPKGLFL
jgi:hypothetical protein